MPLVWPLCESGFHFLRRRRFFLQPIPIRPPHGLDTVFGGMPERRGFDQPLAAWQEIALLRRGDLCFVAAHRPRLQPPHIRSRWTQVLGAEISFAVIGSTVALST